MALFCKKNVTINGHPICLKNFDLGVLGRLNRVRPRSMKKVDPCLILFASWSVAAGLSVQNFYPCCRFNVATAVFDSWPGPWRSRALRLVSFFLPPSHPFNLFVSPFGYLFIQRGVLRAKGWLRWWLFPWRNPLADTWSALSSRYPYLGIPLSQFPFPLPFSFWSLLKTG